MPEFEENTQTNKTDDKYIPSTDAKPRSRRRSGGFKSDYTNNDSLNIGEVEPNQVLKEEALKKPTRDLEAETASSVKEEPSQANTERKPMTKKAPLSQETLRVIQEVEEKIAEKKLTREAQQKDRKSRKPRGKKKTGLFASIFNGLKSLLGIKPKKKGPYRRKGQRPNYKKKRYPRRKS